jgi:DNA-binding MarR family transcriptional regulator
MSRPGDLERLDAALMRLRRLWTAPRTQAGMRAGDEPVELSTVLVVDALARGPEQHLGVADVAERLDVTPSTASRLVDRAVAAGMVERRVAPDDARRADLLLTDAGSALHERARSFRTRYLDSVLAAWPQSDITTLADHLDRFARAVTDAPPPPPQENP